jgi:phosphatidylglycerophosphate synthase
MVTPLDTTILSHVSLVFWFLLVWGITYGIMLRVDFFKGNRQLHAFISFALAVVVAVFSKFLLFIKTVFPWFMLLIIGGMMVLFILRVLGVSDKKISSVMESRENNHITIFILILVILIILSAIGKIYFAPGEANTTPDVEFVGGEVPMMAEDVTLSGGGSSSGVGEGAFWETFFNPKVLGFMVIMLCAGFTLIFLARDTFVS